MVFSPLSRHLLANPVECRFESFSLCTPNVREELRIKVIDALIVNDHVEIRRIIREFLGTTANVVALDEAVDGIDAIDKTVQLDPDVVLMGISMPQRESLEATRIT